MNVSGIEGQEPAKSGSFVAIQTCRERGGPMRFPAGIILSLALVTGAAAQTSAPPATAVATFAGGCFWCVEADFDKVEGVISTTSGYIGGLVVNPTYEQVVTGRTGHTEAVEIVYDPAAVSYERLLDVFWRNHDPLVKDRQFCDRGNQYRPAIFYHNDEQRRLAEATRQKHQTRFKQPIQTEITAASTFYKAEDYHQDYYKKNPVRYQFYRFNCGRDARLEELWGKPGS
jgi:peptide-methionine (S)-S-oxide reductase